MVEFYGLIQLMDEIVLQERGWKYHLLSDRGYYVLVSNQILMTHEKILRLKVKKDNN